MTPSELRALLDASTPGPWAWDSDPVKGDPYGRVRYQVCAPGKTVTKIYYSSYEGGPTNAEADAKLIVAAVNALAALLDRCDAAEQQTRELQSGLVKIAKIDYANAATNGAAYNAVMIARITLEGK